MNVRTAVLNVRLTPANIFVSSRRPAIILIMPRPVRLIAKMSDHLPVSETVQLTTPPAVLPNAQAGKAAITGRVYHLYQQVDTAVDIRQSVDMTAERQAFMILVVKENLVKVVIKSAKVMDFQIVMICKIVVEPPAVPRFSLIASASSVAT